jgi:hypothetical protein
VDGRVWTAAIVGSQRSEPMPPDTEARVGDFADLVATAIANAATRAEIIASRARIVAAADDARRRLERDLHDGAQQRLVSLGLQTRLAEASVPSQLDGPQDPTVSRCFGFDGHLNRPAGDLARKSILRSCPRADVVPRSRHWLAAAPSPSASTSTSTSTDTCLTRSKSARTTSRPRR